MPKPRPGRGGYREPSSPAPASGPGALSQRTDGLASERAARGIVNDTPSTGYGNKAALQQAQSSIPPGRAAPRGPQAPDLYAPSRRPDEALTSGSAAGPGPGPMNLLAPDPGAALRAVLATFPHPDVVRLARHHGII